MTNSAADAYANYLLTEDENQDALEQILKEKGVACEGEHHAVIGHAYLDEDDLPKDKTMMNEYMDAHGLLLELKEERTRLNEEGLTHVGVGFAADKRIVKVVELISKRPLYISRLTQNEQGGVRVDGMIVPPTGGAAPVGGLYAARIVTESVRTSGDLKKHIVWAGPPQMTMEKTKEFQINFPAPELDMPVFHASQQGGESNYLEIYVRTSGNAANIKYGVADNEKINFQHLKLVYRIAMDIFPDPRIEIEDAKDQEDLQRHRVEME